MKRIFLALLRRILGGFALLLGASFIIYMTVRAAPGDAIDAISPMGTPPEVKAQLMAEFGLDRGPLAGYGVWALRSLCGDFGDSLVFAPGERVMAVALPAFGRTLLLAGGALLVCLCFALLWAACNPGGSRRSQLLGASLYGVTSAPSFVIAVAFAQAVNELVYRLVDARGFVTPSWYPIPIACSSMMPYLFAGITLILSDGLLIDLVNYLRSELQALRRSPFIAAIRAKGARVTGHLLKNMVVPILSAYASRLPVVLGGVVIVEYVFTLDGAGYVLLEASKNRDFPMVVGLSVLFTALVILVNIISDVVKGWLDAREVAHGG